MQFVSDYKQPKFLTFYAKSMSYVVDVNLFLNWEKLAPHIYI